MATPPGHSGARSDAVRPRAADVHRRKSMIPGRRPECEAKNRRIFGRGISGLASPARAAAVVATRRALVPDLRALLGQPGLHGCMTGALEPHLDVVGVLGP